MAQHDTGLGWTLKDSYSHSGVGTIGEFRSPSQLNNDFPYLNSDYYPAESSFIAGDKYFLMGANQVYGLIFGRTGSWPEEARNCFVYKSGTTVYACFVSTTSFTLRQYNLAFHDVTSHTGVYNATLASPSSIYNSESGLYYYSFNIKSGYSGTLTGGTIPVYNTLQAGLNDLAGTRYTVYKLNSGEALACIAKFHDINGVTRISPVIISTNADYCVLSLDNTNPAPELLRISALYQGVSFTMGYFPTWGEMSVTAPFAPIADISNFPALLPKGILNAIAQPDWGNIIVLNSPDPYQEADGTSGEEGGDGDTEVEDNPVEEETLPLPSVAGLGFCTIYVPTDTDLMNLAAYLWGGNLNLDTFLRLFANPMDSILGLSVVPLSLSGISSPVYMGGQLLENITMPKYNGRTSLKVDMGTTTIEKRWGSYLDYDPYTELSLYLPFIGIKNIKADDVMDKTISLMYSIDILSGACVAYIRPVGGSVLYEWSGQCALQVPVTGQNWDNIFATAATTAAALGGALFAPSAPSAGVIASTAVQAIAAKPRVERSGAVNGITGFLGQMRPYLIRVIPDAYIPDNQNKFIGYPSFVTASLGSLTGYNEVSSIHLEGIPATGNELAEIETLLKGGVIF